MLLLAHDIKYPRLPWLYYFKSDSIKQKQLLKSIAEAFVSKANIISAGDGGL